MNAKRARGKRHMLKDLTVDRVSAVDKPAFGGAVKVIMKRRDEDEGKLDDILKRMRFTSSVMGHPHLIDDSQEGGETSYQAGHRHPFVRLPGGDILIGDSKETDGEVHSHDALDASVVVVDDDYEEEPVEKGKKTERIGGKPAQFGPGDYAYVPDSEKPSTWKIRLTNTPGGAPDSQIVGAAVAALGAGFRGQKARIPSDDRAAVVGKVRAAWLKANPDKSKEDLPDVLKSASMEETMEKTKEQWEAEIGTLTTKLVRAEAVMGLSDIEKAHLKGLDEKGQDEFLKMAPEARKALVEKAQKADETLEVAGVTVRKSVVGESTFAILASAEQARKDAIQKAAAEVAKREDVELEKRADSEIPHLPGETKVKVAMLRAIDGIQDTEVRKSALESLKANNEAMALAIKNRGSDGIGDPSGPGAQMDALAKKLMVEKNIPYATAYDEISKTEEGKRLYDEAEKAKKQR